MTRETRPWNDKTRLKELYEDEGLSTLEIASKFNTDANTILAHLNKFGIETRTEFGNRKYSTDELKWWINAFVEEIGHVPSASEMADAPGPHPMTYRSRFGSWSAGIEASGYEPKEGGHDNGQKYGYIKSERGKE